MSTTSLPLIVHDSFVVPDADIHLVSKDNVVFQVYSNSLRLVSGFFEAILSLPQENTGQIEAQSISLDEDASVLEILLGIACGRTVGFSFVYRASLDLVEDVLRAADKYEIHAASAYFRTLFTTAVANVGFPNTSFSDPLRLFVICRRYEWFAEADRAFARTLDINILESSHAVSLRRLNATDLVDMLLLRKKRKDKLAMWLEDPDAFPFVRSCMRVPLWMCRDCHTALPTMPVSMAWRDIRDHVLNEVEHRPSGTSIGLDTSESRIWPLLGALKRSWTCVGCGKGHYDAAEVVLMLRRVLQKLPNKVEELF